jgi:hypothetical protein
MSDRMKIGNKSQRTVSPVVREDALKQIMAQMFEAYNTDAAEKMARLLGSYHDQFVEERLRRIEFILGIRLWGWVKARFEPDENLTPELDLTETPDAPDA